MNERPIAINPRIHKNIIDKRFNLPDGLLEMSPPGLAGLLIAHMLMSGRGTRLLLDVDGVLAVPTEWERTVVYPLVIAALKKLEDAGADFGLLTARGEDIVTHLRKLLHFRVADHKGLEGGGLVIIREFPGRPDLTQRRSCYDDPKLAHEFVALLEQKKSTHFWDDYSTLPKHTFCDPPKLWKRGMRKSYWFRHNPSIDNPYEQPMYLDVIKPFVIECAKELHIPEGAIDFQINQTDTGISYILISLNANQEVITKATLLADDKIPTIFIADGHGDVEAARDFNKKRGLVIGVESNLGKSKQKEVEEFRNEAAVVLSGPYDLAKALTYAHKYLTR